MSDEITLQIAIFDMFLINSSFFNPINNFISFQFAYILYSPNLSSFFYQINLSTKLFSSMFPPLPFDSVLICRSLSFCLLHFFLGSLVTWSLQSQSQSQSQFDNFISFCGIFLPHYALECFLFSPSHTDACLVLTIRFTNVVYH